MYNYTVRARMSKKLDHKHVETNPQTFSQKYMYVNMATTVLVEFKGILLTKASVIDKKDKLAGC